jgi:hypothetical protein
LLFVAAFLIAISTGFANQAAPEPAASATAATPNPASTPPKEIINVRTRALCSTLTQRIAPAVAGIIKNDQLIDLGRHEIGKLGADVAAQSNRAHMDQLELKNIVDAMVHNLATIDGIMDSARFSAAPTTDDERLAAAMKEHLLAVAARQRAAINVLDGMVETSDLGTLPHEGIDDSPALTIAMKPAAPGATPQAGGMSAAGMNPGPADQLGDISSGSPYEVFARYEAATQIVEGQLAGELKSAAIACGGSSQSPK